MPATRERATEKRAEPSAGRASTGEVSALEERAFNAWPAAQTLLGGGWLLRLAGGYTKRANSLNALCPVAGIDDALAWAGGYFDAAGLDRIVRVTPLAGAADTRLAALGYRHVDQSLVMTLGVPAPFPMDQDVRILSAPTPAWLHDVQTANDVPAASRSAHGRLVSSIVPPSAYASLVDEGGAPMAWGLAVVDRGMVGLFAIVTAPARRRQGVGRRLVTSLIGWGQGLGATGAYLQVEADNVSAIRLYERLGFTEAYRYHYRVLAKRRD